MYVLVIFFYFRYVLLLISISNTILHTYTLAVRKLTRAQVLEKLKRNLSKQIKKKKLLWREVRNCGQKKYVHTFVIKKEPCVFYSGLGGLFVKLVVWGISRIHRVFVDTS